MLKKKSDSKKERNSSISMIQIIAYVPSRIRVSRATKTKMIFQAPKVRNEEKGKKNAEIYKSIVKRYIREWTFF